MSDPLVSRAADRSGFDVNGDLFALLESLQGVLEEVERAPRRERARTAGGTQQW
jgi:hypothetical protein